MLEPPKRRKEIEMRKIVAVLALVAGVAGSVAATSSAAQARPSVCAAIWQAMSDSLDMASDAYEHGDSAGGDEWVDTYWMASRNYKRFRC
ncbi:hypothetical protein Amac_059120 [Acrocarpospora macrocephala]|uniref:Uncharacterized protein n=2 Tax=Acrocarpospora macrocephala TaxID=150177 RepID=A0A5M3WSI1_9ACTN|nr:hypothetical protein Amac_059120 [Acrocarpospora macrocephala]